MLPTIIRRHWALVVRSFSHGPWQTEAGESLILRLVWSTDGITGQPNMETASLVKPKPKQNKQTKR